ncbi:MAG: hypothetical protein WEC34_11980 [Acidimicrobiia bacterium]
MTMRDVMLFVSTCTVRSLRSHWPIASVNFIPPQPDFAVNA